MKLITFIFALCVALAGAAHPLCGTWRLTSSGAEIRISPSTTAPGAFDIALVHSPSDLSLAPGLHIGEASATATPGRFVAKMKVAPGTLDKRTRRLVLTVRDDGSMSFEPYTTGKRLHLWRWLPYIFRVGVLQEHEPPRDIEGAVRTDDIDYTQYRLL